MTYGELRQFLGPAVLRYLYSGAFLGAALFLIELLFALTLQGFLGAMGLIDSESLRLPASFPRGLAANAGILALFGLLRAAALLYRQYAQTIVNIAFVRLQRRRIAQACFARPQTATLAEASALFSDITLRAGLCLNHLLGLVVNALAGGCLLVAGLRIAPIETVIGCFLLGAFLLPLRLLNKRVDDAGVGLSEEWQELNDRLVNGMRHNFFLRVSGLLDREIAAVDRGAQAYLDHYKRYAMVTAQKANIPLFLGVLVIASVSYVSLTHLDTPPALLLSFFYIFLRMAQSVGVTLSSLASFQLQKPAFRQVLQWWRTAEREEAQTRVAEPLSPAESRRLASTVDERGIEIRASNVSFSYSMPGPRVIDGVSFTVKTGDVLIVTGESGSGKSTLLALLFGVFPPREGSVRVLETDMFRAKEALYPRIGYAGPEPYLVAGSVREILRYGHPDPDSISEEKMRGALKTAQALDFVSRLDGGLDAYIHETAQLSTGQKQRLAIARVLLREPKLLILDEFTANLDHDTETQLIGALKPLLPRMTTVIATHRPLLRELGTQALALGRG